MSTQTCPLCQNQSTRVKYSDLYDDRYGYPGKFKLLECQNCAHLFLENSFKNEDFSRLYTQFYPRAQMKLEEFQAHQPKEGWRRNWLGEGSAAYTWVPAGVRVLDIGCGFGQSVAYHAGRGSIATGVDADENVRKVAEKFKLDIRVGVFSLNLFKNEKFDYITLDQVLEHSQNPVQFLNEIQTLLTQNGKVVLSLPNAFGLGARVFGKKWIHWHTPYHLQFFSKKSLAVLLTQVPSLEMESVNYVTHSHWIFYQMLALFTYPEMGKKSVFWSNGQFSFFQKVLRKGFGIMLKLGVFHVYTRMIDFLKLGDNQVVVLRQKS